MDFVSNILKNHTFRTNVVPVSLLITSPIIVIALWQISTLHNGSTEDWVMGLPGTLINDFPTFSMECAKYFGLMTLMQFVLLVVLPGQSHYSSITPMGNRPWYKLNGPLSYVVTHLIMFALWYYEIFSLSWVFFNFGDWLLTSSVIAIVLCLYFYVKGIYFPSTSDSGRTGSGFIWDYWWGTELHPTILGFCVKQLVNCRIGMTCLWQLLNWSAVVYQYDVYGQVSYGLWCSVLLQFFYLYKFFLWEDGYFASMDIQHDRFGYYICWGILNWVPGLYPYAAMNMAHRPDNMSLLKAMIIFILGIVAVACNYWADVQRQQVRASDGKCKIWGKPAKIIRATYKTGDGKTHKSILLYSGFWGVSRHFHYIAELSSCFFWTLPAGFDLISPWVYVIFLTILLTDRAYRDELRCQKKYGKFWTEYRKKVPYRMIPYVY